MDALLCQIDAKLHRTINLAQSRARSRARKREQKTRVETRPFSKRRKMFATLNSMLTVVTLKRYIGKNVSLLKGTLQSSGNCAENVDFNADASDSGDLEKV
jgi:hypothetical protein